MPLFCDGVRFSGSHNPMGYFIRSQLGTLCVFWSPLDWCLLFDVSLELSFKICQWFASQRCVQFGSDWITSHDDGECVCTEVNMSQHNTHTHIPVGAVFVVEGF